MGVLNNYNYIDQILHFPCATPEPLITVKAGLAAGSLAMLEFFSWGCRDFLKARLGRAQPCGRFMAAAMRGPPKGAHIIDKANKIYQFFGPIDRIAYAMLIADIGSTFFARWHSFAYAMSGCIPSEQSGEFQFHLAAPFGLHEGDEAQVPWHLDPEYPFGIGAGMDCPSNWYFSLAWSVRCRPIFSNGLANYDTYVHESGGTFSFDFEANNHKSWYAGNSLHGSHQLSTQNKAGRTVIYRPTVIAHEDLICYEGKANVTVSPLPVLGTWIKPISCFNYDLTSYFPEGILGEP